jgi:hypothetical protein
MSQSITLNLPYDLADSEWAKVTAVYESMGDWVPGQAVACWFGPLDSSNFLAASIEPSGLVLEGKVDPLLFRGWVTKLCAKLTLALGREVYDAEV